ncbi:unnamed protein product [Cuscuta europaea]|uniref:Uncharacterized protein n=1 Tax=Cuscuta europaea TaxID=41803 RepID=A0A9P0ZXH6_CUSEU|nr:unnamed protein product [Cuscuta europaea]
MSLPDFYVIFEMSLPVCTSLLDVTVPGNVTVSSEFFLMTFPRQNFCWKPHPAALTPPPSRESAYGHYPSPSLLPCTPSPSPAPQPPPLHPSPLPLLSATCSHPQ